MKESPQYHISNSEKSLKQSLWEQQVTSLSETEDSLPIDENIKEAIVALNVHGIHTIASCGGHITEERHTGDSLFPWILISNIDQKGDDEDQNRSDIALLHSKLKAFLVEFYNGRQTEEGSRLKIDDVQYGEFILSSKVDEDSNEENKSRELTKEEKNDLVAKLSKRQQEMKDFGQFLKSKFLSDD